MGIEYYSENNIILIMAFLFILIMFIMSIFVIENDEVEEDISKIFLNPIKIK